MKSVHLLEEVIAVASMGEGPIEEGAFDDLLRLTGLDVNIPGPGSEILIVGRTNWDAAELRRIVDARAGQQLRVYSQEMFTAYMLSGVDPLLEDDDRVLELAGDHPALQFLREVGFHWPSTLVPVAEAAGNVEIDIQEISPLKLYGYSVGRSGMRVQVRRDVLARVYEADLTAEDYPADYLDKWGLPASTARLKAMADVIAANCRRNRPKGRTMSEAIADWEDDLEWLKLKYYNQHVRFQWPSTDVY